MMRSNWRTVAVVLILVSTFAASARASETVLVFAAASLKGPLDEVAALYEVESGQDVTLSYAGSSALARQIEAGAPADIFLSASPDWVEHLVSLGLVQSTNVAPLLTNRLALIAPAQDGRATGLNALSEVLADGWMAMALIDAVPAGVYGKQALNHLGLWPVVQDHIAQTDNVSAALRLVALGEAPLGIVYETDAMAEPRVRLVQLFPTDSHDPILYPVAQLGGGASQGFFDYLQGAAAAEVFSRSGFGLAGQAQ